MTLVDALGNLVRFLLLSGQAHDMKGVAPLFKGVSFDALLADKAFDAKLAARRNKRTRRNLRDPTEIEPKASTRLRR